ncbi:hypothetical protein [Pseudomonas sp.]|uniref:hypothetical protein n=1 Tax=Pseudomonas sp. TaxID=306 RepID=UPI003D6EF63D
MAPTALPTAAAMATAVVLAGNDSPDPRLNPIRRVNPNSRQGSVPATPPVHGPTTQPNPRLPTLENRGVGNGQTIRREQITPRLEPSRPPRESIRTP